eukprot:7303072-Alexandrium_andersonii.AAC.1
MCRICFELLPTCTCHIPMPMCFHHGVSTVSWELSHRRLRFARGANRRVRAAPASALAQEVAP